MNRSDLFWLLFSAFGMGCQAMVLPSKFKLERSIAR